MVQLPFQRAIFEEFIDRFSHCQGFAKHLSQFPTALSIEAPWIHIHKYFSDGAAAMQL
jgi:hypothetical protein